MGRRENHCLGQVLLGALGTASWMPVLGNETRRAAPEWGWTLALEARGEAGEERGGKNMSVQKGKGTWDFPQNVCYRAGGSKEKGTGQAWHRTALPWEETGMAPQATHAARTAHLSLLLPPSVPKDTMHLLCKGYSPKPGGQASKLWECVPRCKAAKQGPAPAAGGTDPCFQRGCWGAGWARGALNTPRRSVSRC